MLRLWRATINTRNGLAFAIRSEQAVREELVILALSVPLAWLIGATTMRRVVSELSQRFVSVRDLARSSGIVATTKAGTFPAALRRSKTSIKS